MTSQDFEVGDLVWAQMRGYPPWPSKIFQPPANAKVKAKKGHYCVYFFGTKNYAWIPDDKIFPHGEDMLQKASKRKSGPFHIAVKELVSASKALRRRIDQGKNTNSGQMQKKNKALKAKKSVMKKKALIEKSRIKKKALIEKKRKMNIPEYKFVFIRPGSEFSDSAKKCSEEKKVIPPPPTPPLNIKKESLKNKDVKPTFNKIGFLGLGAIGQRIVMNLFNSGHDVTVWSQTPEKCDVFIEAGAHSAQTPADVIQACDITYCCLSDTEATRDLIFGNSGVLKGLESCTPGKKGYVDLTGIDPQTSQEIASEITKAGGRYLEARINGSRSLAESGLLLILAAGDSSVFQACESCFLAISRHTYFIDISVGNASRMSLILSMFHGTVTGALAEAVSLVYNYKLNIDHFLEILAVGPAGCPLVKEKGKAMREENFTTNFSIKHQQRDLCHAITMGDFVNQPLKISAAAKEVFKRAKQRYENHDVSAVIQAVRY